MTWKDEKEPRCVPRKVDLGDLLEDELKDKTAPYVLNQTEPGHGSSLWDNEEHCWGEGRRGEEWGKQRLCRQGSNLL